MNQNKTLQEAIEKIGAFNRFGSKPGLERILELCRRLGNPQDQLKAIHVAGTNGKGSVCRYVYMVLQACGYRTGLFISPYLERFTERIEWNGGEISPEDLLRISDLVIEKAEEMTAEGLESPTEFEVVTAIAFCYFAEKKADFVVLEVGLGGRGDSTNAIKESLVSAITSISLDHTEYLGATLEQIAWEKAGIIKPGGRVVSAVKGERVKNVIRNICREKGAKLDEADLHVAEIQSKDENGTVFDALPFFPDMKISMMGKHQVQNALTALAILVQLEDAAGIHLPLDQIQEGMRKAKQPGRIEILWKNPLIIIDGAHNQESVDALAETMSSIPACAGRNRLLVTGVLKDKDAVGMAAALAAISKDVIVTEPDSPRKMPCGELAKIYGQVGVKGEIRVVKDCLEAARMVMEEIVDQGNPNGYEMVLFTGSLYLIGKVRSYMSAYLSESKTCCRS